MPRFHSPTDEAIGARLRTYRQAARLSQSDVGNHLGVTFQQIQKYENGKNRLSGSRLVEVSRLLKVEPGVILGTNGAAGGTNEHFDALTDRNVVKMVIALKGLPKPRRTAVAIAVLELIRAFGAKA